MSALREKPDDKVMVRERTERTRTGFPGVRGRDPKGNDLRDNSLARPVHPFLLPFLSWPPSLDFAAAFP
jgi:hypothetical protein